MKIEVNGTSKEIAALVQALQEQQKPENNKEYTIVRKPFTRNEFEIVRRN